MQPAQLLRKQSPVIILAILLSIVYLQTMAPGLTWANDGADGGDLITAAATGGVPHPTGYPTYLLLAGWAQKLPFGSLAFRTNLMSAIATVLAAVLLYRLVVRSVAPADPNRYWPAGLIAGLAFGLSPLVWSQAIITEVYALQSLLIILIIHSSAGAFALSKSSDRFAGMLLGLALGNHITAILLVPLVLLAQTVYPPNASRGWAFHGKSFIHRSVFCLCGLLIYLTLPLRAAAHSPVNWGNPITWNRFWWLVSGKLYAVNFYPIVNADLGLRIQAFASLLLQQWGVAGLILALLGLVYFFSPNRLYLFTIWQAAAYTGFALFYKPSDSYVYLLPVCISFSIWIGLGAAKIMDSSLLRTRRFGLAFGGLMLIYLLGFAAYHWPYVDASHDLRAEKFGQQVLESAPPQAVIFAEGDQALFTLWYFHFALGERSDLTVLSTDLLHFDWYQGIVKSLYPSLAISGDLPWPETIISDNPQLPFCYVGYNQVEQAVIECTQPMIGSRLVR